MVHFKCRQMVRICMDLFEVPVKWFIIVYGENWGPREPLRLGLSGKRIGELCSKFES